MSTDDRLAVKSTHTLLRWLAVLPAAILAGWMAHFALGLLSLAVASVLSESAAYYAQLLLYYAPKDASFVIVGARLAPRPLATAVALAVAAMAVSLLVHILGQRTVGVTNYLHFAAESAGAVFGAACTYATTRTAVVARSPDRATFATAGLPTQRT